MFGSGLNNKGQASIIWPWSNKKVLRLQSEDFVTKLLKRVMPVPARLPFQPL